MSTQEGASQTGSVVQTPNQPETEFRVLSTSCGSSHTLALISKQHSGCLVCTCFCICMLCRHWSLNVSWGPCLGLFLSSAQRIHTFAYLLQVCKAELHGCRRRSRRVPGAEERTDN